MQEIKNISGKTWSIDTATGEATEMVTLVVPLGTKTITPEQQQANIKRAKALKEKEQKEFFRKLQRHELGNFYFIFCENAFDGLKPQTIAKLVMLCTYLNYDNQLMLTPKTAMTKRDIATVLKLSKTASHNFYNEVINRYIIENERGLYISPDVNIFRHKLPKPTGQQFLHYQKAYITSIRKLYNQTSSRKHKQLGYIFQLLPHINLQFNILCNDAFQTELDMIEALTISDLCRLIDYDCNQSSRLLKELKTLVFDYKGKPEYLISYVDNGTGRKRMFINPHIVYNGTDYQRVEILGAFCKV